MSEGKLLKYLDKTKDIKSSVISLKRQPIVLSDSKGNYLKTFADSGFEKDIVWCCKGGASVNQSFDWFVTKAQQLYKKYGKFELFVWLGTCDFTHKNKNYISLNPSYCEEDIVCKFTQLSQLGKEIGFHVTFLETPIYSIVEWNRCKGHKCPEDFLEQDCKLENLVTSLNHQIGLLNITNQTSSPKFSLDLLRNRKNKKKSSKYHYNFHLYKDGIHSRSVLSRYWLRKLTEVIVRNCC